MRIKRIERGEIDPARANHIEKLLARKRGEALPDSPQPEAPSGNTPIWSARTGQFLRDVTDAQLRQLIDRSAIFTATGPDGDRCYLRTAGGEAGGRLAPRGVRSPYRTLAATKSGRVPVFMQKRIGYGGGLVRWDERQSFRGPVRPIVASKAA